MSGRYAFGKSDQVFPLGSLGGFGSGSRLANFAQISPTRVQVVSVSWLTTFTTTKNQRGSLWLYAIPHQLQFGRCDAGKSELH